MVGSSDSLISMDDLYVISNADLMNLVKKVYNSELDLDNYEIPTKLKHMFFVFNLQFHVSSPDFSGNVIINCHNPKLFCLVSSLIVVYLTDLGFDRITILLLISNLAKEANSSGHYMELLLDVIPKMLN